MKLNVIKIPINSYKPTKGSHEGMELRKCGLLNVKTNQEVMDC